MSDETSPGRANRPGAGAEGDHERAAAYTIRPFEPGDRDAYLRLHERTLAEPTTERWFSWKYEENPFVDHVPVTVAERDGAVVGAASGFPLRLRCGGDAVLAYGSCEGFVHPDHRRRGVFTRLVRDAWERAADQGMAFVFGMTGNEKTLAAHTKYNDWRPVEPLPRSYRFQRPAELLAAETGTPGLGRFGPLLGPAVRGVHRLRFDLADVDTDRVTMRRYGEVPSEHLASLYDDHVPETIHVVRDEQFYDWRFRNPNRDYAFYVAHDADDPVAALTTCTDTGGAYVDTKVMDVLPLHPGADEDAVGALLQAALRDHAHAAVVSVLPRMLSRDLLSAFGFVRQDRFPLSTFTRPIYHGVRPLGDGGADGVPSAEHLRDPSNWQLSYLENDAS